MKRCSVCGKVQKSVPGKKLTPYCGGDKCTTPKDQRLKRCIYCGSLDRAEKQDPKSLICPNSMSQGRHNFGVD